MAWSERDYLEITVDQAITQWSDVLNRSVLLAGQQQGSYLPIETLLANAATILIKANGYGGANSHKAGEPIPSLARVFKRTPGSILLKMANIDGTRKNGARNDQWVGREIDPGSQMFTIIYQVIFEAARFVGIPQTVLPDFLGIETGEAFQFLGQEVLTSSAVEQVLERELPRFMADQPGLTESETERLFLTSVRRGQHRFAKEVLHNCGSSCVFCGMTSPIRTPKTLLVASHIKPWSQSNNKERLDFKNGVAACPTHDKAFDTGLITVTQQLKVQLSPRLREHLEQDPAARAAFGSPPLRSVIDFDWREKRVGNVYLEWHREKVFQTD